MNAVDIAILVVLAVFLLKGLWLGVINELCMLIGLGGGAFLANRYHDALGQALQHWVGFPPELLGICAYVLLFLVTLLVCGLLGYVLSRLVKLIFLGGFNRILGGLLGLAQGVVLLTLVLYGLSLTSWLPETRQTSRLAPPFVALGEQLLAGKQAAPR